MALVTALLVPPPVFADPPETAATPSESISAVDPTLELGNLFTPTQATLTSYEDAVRFANVVIAKGKEKRRELSLPEDTVLEAQLLHLGADVNPHFEWVIKYLARNGIAVQGTFVQRAQFDKVLATIMANWPSQQALDAFVVGFENETGVQPEFAEDHQSTYQKIKTGLQWISNKVFGAPYGITLLSHFVEKPDESSWWKFWSWRWRFGKDESLNRVAASVLKGALSWIVGVRVVGGWVQGYLSKVGLGGAWQNLTSSEVWTERYHSVTSWDTWSALPAQAWSVAEQIPSQSIEWATSKPGLEFMSILAIVGTWVYFCLRFSREIDSFRRQGLTVRTSPRAPEGKQITTAAHDGGYLAACTSQECVLNTVILGTMVGFGTAQLTWFTGPQKLWNALLAAFSYSAMEEARGGLLQKAERVEPSDPEQAAKLKGRAEWMAKIFWNLPFPLAANMGQYLKGWITNIPLAVLGMGGFLYRLYNRSVNNNAEALAHELLHPELTDSVSPKEVAGLMNPLETPECKDLIILRAVLPK